MCPNFLLFCTFIWLPFLARVQETQLKLTVGWDLIKDRALEFSETRLVARSVCFPSTDRFINSKALTSSQKQKKNTTSRRLVCSWVDCIKRSHIDQVTGIAICGLVQQTRWFVLLFFDERLTWSLHVKGKYTQLFTGCPLSQARQKLSIFGEKKVIKSFPFAWSKFDTFHNYKSRLVAMNVSFRKILFYPTRITRIIRTDSIAITQTS